MVAAFLRFILFVLVAWFVYLFWRVSRALKRARTGPSTRTAPREERGLMVKDEVCGTYVPRDEALTETRGGVERYYCSEECRRKSGRG